jgi:Zn-finger nucleic acid-binding protein
MSCPVCPKSELQPLKLPSGLTVRLCKSCDGRWLPFDEHMRWVSSGEAEKSIANLTPATAPIDPNIEPPHKPRLCPRCGRFLIRHRISLDLPFTLDRCGVCAGVWFDSGEWAAVESRALLPRLNHLFNDAHQHRMAMEQRRRDYESRCRSIVGEDAYHRAIEIKKWLATHPHAATIRAYLDERELTP